LPGTAAADESVLLRDGFVGWQREIVGEFQFHSAATSLQHAPTFTSFLSHWSLISRLAMGGATMPL
jgi:aminoglycoside/choline kinase family phosphotransferase